MDDDGENVKLTFGTLPTRVNAGTNNEATVNLTDHDYPAVTVASQQGSYTVAEESSINITLTMTPDPERTVEIPLNATNQGGATDDDHSLIPETVYFNAGQNSRIFSFQVDQDTEDDEGVSVKIAFGTLPTRVSAGTTKDNGGVNYRATGPSGVHHFEITSLDGNTGTYQIRIRVNNICVISGGQPRYTYGGGPEGYTFDNAPDESTTSFLRPMLNENIHHGTGSLLGDSWSWYWEQNPDVYWYRVEGVSEDYEYTIEVWTPDETPTKHQATQLRIPGLFDQDSMEVVGPTAAGKRVSVTFQPEENGMYYISVGSVSSDRTGFYLIHLDDQDMNGTSSQRIGRSQKGNGQPGGKDTKDASPPKERGG